MGTKYCYSIAHVGPTQQHPGTLWRYGVPANDGSDSAVIPESTALTIGKARIADGDYTGFRYGRTADLASPRQIV
jgi:hypothetical protein